MTDTIESPRTQLDATIRERDEAMTNNNKILLAVLWLALVKLGLAVMALGLLLK